VLTELNKDPHKLEEICASFDLHPRGSAGEHSDSVRGKWDILINHCFGFTEVHLVQKMIDCVKKLIQTELELSQEATVVAESQEYGIFRLGFHELYASLFVFKYKVIDKIL
jgi:hypothetical protein